MTLIAEYKIHKSFARYSNINWHDRIKHNMIIFDWLYVLHDSCVMALHLAHTVNQTAPNCVDIFGGICVLWFLQWNGKSSFEFDVERRHYPFSWH